MLFSVFMFSASWDGLSVKEQSLKRFQSKCVACNFCNLFASYYIVCFMSSSVFRICLSFSRFGSLNLLSLLKLIQVWVGLWCSLQVLISCMIWICLCFCMSFLFHLHPLHRVYILLPRLPRQLLPLQAAGPAESLEERTSRHISLSLGSGSIVMSWCLQTSKYLLFHGLPRPKEQANW